LKLTPAIFFEFPTLNALAQFLLAKHPETFARLRTNSGENLVPSVQTHKVQEPRSKTRFRQPSAPVTSVLPQREAIAVVGMSGNFPQAENPEIFWQNLVSGRD